MNWPEPEELQRLVRSMKRAKDRPFREKAAAKRIIGLMKREGAGSLGDTPFGPELDERLKNLLLLKHV